MFYRILCATNLYVMTSFENRDNDRAKVVIKTNSSLGYKEGLLFF
jgi:hypothetical protein